MRQIHQQIWMSLSEADRFKMCAGMFETAKAFARNELPTGLSDVEQRCFLFKRIYGFDLPISKSEAVQKLA